MKITDDYHFEFDIKTQITDQDTVGSGSGERFLLNFTEKAIKCWRREERERKIKL